jgi:hypothetical protein
MSLNMTPTLLRTAGQTMFPPDFVLRYNLHVINIDVYVTRKYDEPSITGTKEEA